MGSQSLTEDDKSDEDRIPDGPPVSRVPRNSDVEKTAGSTTTTVPTEPLVDGGARAWLQVVGSFLVFTNLWGFAFAFGSFQTYYEITYLPSESPSDISWIGTVSTFLLVFGGTLSGPLFDLGYFRSMLIAGALIETLSVFLMSLCDKYWQLFLTQAVLMGLGSGLLYIPGLSLVTRSFKKYRSIAMAITTCGAPIGGIIYTLMFQQLISRMSFGSTVRAMGYVMLGTYCISFPLMLWGASNLGNIGSGSKRIMFDVNALKDLPFWSFSISQFLIFWGYLVPFIYLATFGQTQLGLSRSFSLVLIMVAQASSVFGRLVAGSAAACFGVMMPWSICALSSGVFCLSWIAVRERGSYIAFAVLYGCFSGALIPLPPSVFAHVCPNPEVLGARMGMAQGFSAIASLSGSPIAGALIGLASGKDSYLGLQLFSGLSLVLGGCSLIGLWILLIRRRKLGVFI